MNAVTSHRGPDQTAAWESGQLSLGFNRLAIIDLSERASQPMWDASGEIVIVFNGEIYNFKELRAELEKSYSFKSESDTEVILYSYRAWGIECVKKFNGMFAFALWDARTQELFMARDPIGIKPLYYFFDGRRLIFSSEIKAILEHDIPRAVDRTAFNLFFSLLYVPGPYTMFAGIKKLPAGSFLRFSAGALAIQRYWEPAPAHELGGSYAEGVRRVRVLFDDAVRRQLVSDRPVGVYLSGGLDSSAVLGAARAHAPERTKTFSVGYIVSPEDEEKFNADFLLARQTAKLYATDHHELMISGRDVLECLDDVVWHLDEPNFNPTAAAIYLLSGEAKKTVAVALGGDGGDELFGGYPRYYYSRWLSHLHRFPGAPATAALLAGIAGKRTLARQLRLGATAERVAAFLAQKPSVRREALNPETAGEEAAIAYLAERFFNGRERAEDFERLFMDIDRQSWLVDESLLRTDKMTMAAGLEHRVPILDYRLVELAYQLPTRWKFSVWNQRPAAFQGKRIWREAVRDYLPPHVLNEKKRGWFTPLAKWLRGDLREYVSEVLSPTNLHREYFNPVGVEEIWKDHVTGKRYNLNMIWAIVMWELWYKTFIKR